MTPQFLRDEAARFRGMAEVTEREASKLRLLTMATKYEAQAKAADETAEPKATEAIKIKVQKVTSEPNEAI